MSSTTTVAPGFTALTLSLIAFFSASVSFSGFAATVLSAGLTMSFPAFGLVASSAVLTKSVAGITAVFPSGVVTVAFPLSSTTTVAPGFTALTLSSIAFFSASVNFSGFAATVLSAGLTTSFPAFGFTASTSVLTKSFPRITAVFPSGVVTVAFPLSSTTTVAPGFTALTLSSIAFFSASVSFSGFAATVLSAGLTMSFPAFGLVTSASDLNKSSDGIVAVVPSFRVTVALPSSSNLTDLVSGFSSLNFASALAWSSGSFASPTTLSAGLTILELPAPAFSVSSLVLTKSDAGIAEVLPSGVETETVPFSSIVTIASGFTSSTLATILAFSSSVKLAGSFTITLSSGLLMSFPPLPLSKSASVLTNLAGLIVPLSPFSAVTSIFPSLLYLTSLALGLTFLTSSKILAFSSSVKFAGSFTRTLSIGLLISPIALIAALSASSIVLTSSTLVTASIAALALFATLSTLAFNASLALGDKSLRASISAFLAFASSSIALRAFGLSSTTGSSSIVPLAPSLPTAAPFSVLTTSSVVALSTASFAFSAASFAFLAASAFSSSVASGVLAISSNCFANLSSIAFFAAGLISAVGFTAVTSSTPVFLAASTASCAVLAASGVAAASGCLAISANCASANFLASALAAVFSSSVKSVRLSISLFLSSNAFEIACLAASFAIGVTLLTAVVPVPFAVSTSAFEVALFTASFALSASAFAASLAAFFSASVKSVRASIASSFAFNASSIAFLAADFFAASGFTALTSDTPVFLAVSTACCAAVALSSESAIAG